MPPWEMKQIDVNVSIPGATANQVEYYVTFPIEEAISSFAGIEEIKSTSFPGYSQIKLTLSDSFNDEKELKDKIESSINNLKSNLPRDIRSIEVKQIKSTEFWVASLNLLKFDYQSSEHRELLKSFIQEIKKVPGISNVYEYTSAPSVILNFKPEALSRYQINLLSVHQKVQDYFQFVPIGRITKNGKTTNIEIKQNYNDLNDLQNLIVRGNSSGSLVRLKDLAEVRFGQFKRSNISLIDGKEVAGMDVYKDQSSDVINIVNGINKVVEKFNKEHSVQVEAKMTVDGSSFLKRQLRTLNSNGIAGFILVLVTLFFFFGAKNSLMTSFGLPLSYLTTFTVLSVMGVGIDLISVIGMLLVVGILVDDAIIVSEQYTQYLEGGKEPREAAYLAVQKTMLPVTGTVATTVVAFLPILLNDGGVGKILRGIPIVVISSLVMSWIESFFILPNHLAHFVKVPPKKKKKGLFDKVKYFYTSTLGQILRFRYFVVVSFFAMMIGSFILASKKVPMVFNLRIGNEAVKLVAILKESDSVEQTREKLAPLFKIVQSIDSKKYQNWSAQIGQVWYNGEKSEGERFAGIRITFSEEHDSYKEDFESIKNYLEKEIEKLDKEPFEVLTIEKNIAGHDSARENALSLSVKATDNLDDYLLEKRIKELTKEAKGLKKVYRDSRFHAKGWIFYPDEEQLHSYGVSRYDLASYIRGYVDRSLVHEFRKNGELTNVYSYIEDSNELTFEKLNGLSFILSNGTKVALVKLGSWKKEESVAKILHVDGLKSFEWDLSFDPEVVKKEIFQKEVDKLIVPLKKEFPNAQIALEDADIQSKKNKSSMGKIVATCLLLIFLVLALILKSLIQPVLIVLAIPFGLTGVILAFYFHDQAINIMAMVGVIGMAGVVVNDSLILVDTINSLARAMGEKSRQIIVNAASSRFRPIIITSLTTLGGVFPMAYGIGGDSGFSKTLALAMGWGLLFATFLTLYLLPALIEVTFDCLNLFRKVQRKFLKNKLVENCTDENEVEGSKKQREDAPSLS